MLIPVVYVWTGAFPAEVTIQLIGWLIAFTIMSRLAKLIMWPTQAAFGLPQDIRYACMLADRRWQTSTFSSADAAAAFLQVLGLCFEV